MPTYYVDSNAAGANNGTSWADAYTTTKALIDAIGGFPADSIVYFASNHQDTSVWPSHYTIDAWNGVVLISANSGTGAYEKATADQINFSGTTYNIAFRATWTAYGIRIKGGGHITFEAQQFYRQHWEDCEFLPGPGYWLFPKNSWIELINCTFDFGQDVANVNVYAFEPSGSTWKVRGGSVINCSFRTNALIRTEWSGHYEFSGLDLSQWPTTESFCTGDGDCAVHFSHCKTAATFSLVEAPYQEGRMEFSAVNLGPADDPTLLHLRKQQGDVISDSIVYRTGGASIEGVPVSYALITSSVATRHAPLETPWQYGTVEAGSRTWTAYVANAGAAFDNDEVWLEVEYLDTLDSPNWKSVRGRPVIDAAATTHPNDTSGTWNNPFATQQLVSLTQTVGEGGLYRARLCVGVASIDLTRELYFDPQIVVT